MALSDASTEVSTYAELSKALSEDNGYTYIYLTADITQDDSGIVIHESKSSVVIDGSRNYGKVKFTQKGSGAAKTIRVNNSVSKSVTLCNMEIVGTNSYGIVSAKDERLTLTYKNIDYSGPQITYNKYGSAHYDNCNISINDWRVADISSVTFSGKVTLDKAKSRNEPMFNFPGDTHSVTVSAGASVVANTSCYFINTGRSNNTTLTLEQGSSLTYTGQTQGFVNGSQSLESVSIGEGASLNITQNSSDYNYGTLRIISSLKMEKGSSLIINRTGTNKNGAAIQLINADATAVFLNPHRVKLYSPSKNLVATNTRSTGKMHIETDAVSIWSTSSGLTNDIDPAFFWNKAGGKTLIIDYSFSGSTKVSSNLDGSDITKYLEDKNFDLSKSQMLVFGNFNLVVDKVYKNSEYISGKTENGAFLQIENLYKGGTAIKEYTTSTNYSYPISGQDVGDIFSVTSKFDFLRKVERTTVEEALGSLQLVSVPDRLDFGSHTITAQAEAISPIHNWSIEISDTRGGNSQWRLLATISGPLSGNIGSNAYPLTDALVFTSESKETNALSTSEPFVISSGSGDKTLSWDSNSVGGIFIKANPWEIRSGVTYTTKIQWSLQDAP